MKLWHSQDRLNIGHFGRILRPVEIISDFGFEKSVSRSTGHSFSRSPAIFECEVSFVNRNPISTHAPLRVSHTAHRTRAATPPTMIVSNYNHRRCYRNHCNCNCNCNWSPSSSPQQTTTPSTAKTKISSTEVSKFRVKAEGGYDESGGDDDEPRTAGTTLDDDWVADAAPARHRLNRRLKYVFLF